MVISLSKDRVPAMKHLCASFLFFLASILVGGQDAVAQITVIKGSNTFGEELGPRLLQAYTQTYPGSEFTLESKGSATGFAALLAGECDIAAASRSASEDELRLARSRGITMNHYTAGYYGVGVIVHGENPLRDLSDTQVQAIFTGSLTSWKELGGEDHPIHLYIRDPASGTHVGFQELAMEREPYAEAAKQFVRYREIAERIKQDPYGIGYVDMHVLKEEGLHAVSINGVPVSDIAVNEGLYPYARLLRFYTNADHEPKDARRFIRFVQSRDGRAVLQDMGYMPRLRHIFERPLEIDLW